MGLSAVGQLTLFTKIRGLYKGIKTFVEVDML